MNKKFDIDAMYIEEIIALKRALFITFYDDSDMRKIFERDAKDAINDIQELFYDNISHYTAISLGKISEYINSKKLFDHTDNIFEGLIANGIVTSKEYIEKRHGPIEDNETTLVTPKKIEDIFERMKRMERKIDANTINSRNYIDNWEIYNNIWGENSKYNNK